MAELFSLEDMRSLLVTQESKSDHKGSGNSIIQLIYEDISDDDFDILLSQIFEDNAM